MMMTHRPLLAPLLGLALVACGGAGASTPPAGGTTPAEPADTNAALVARGAEAYGAHCAKCHGAGGEGTDKAPPVVGAAALPLEPQPGKKRTVPFRTAADVLAWVSVAMPGDAPGSLSPDLYLAILAFDLKANGVDLGAEPFTAERAATVVLHP
jgi:mono/diheme cytochrome c family protein